MDSKIITRLFFLIVIFFPTNLIAIEFNGKFLQGHFIVGMTDPSSKIIIDKKNVKVSKDGYFVLSVGNDATFERFCQVASCEYLLEDKKYAEAVERVKNREEVTNKLNEITKTHETEWWLEKLEEKNIGCCAINTLEEVFSDPQVMG